MKTAASDSRRRRSAFVSGNRTGFFSLFGCLTPRAAEELPEKDVSDISRSNSRLRKYQKRDISEASTSGSDKKRSSTSLGMHSSSSSSSRSKDQGGLDFTMDEILKATKNFSPTFIIGQGGFATVYKGCLRGGTVVAIKRAKKVRVLWFHE
ncbi:hypothetical protein M569_16458 [Genlisea aurea]|uniref:Protein kinase domain-containing protein n=1 Tax=Genlisea aurea TaxID=192259 RepID=S8DGA0_9LAMI|nr:hypothetical protein M569_16458 [Genlisea aurea]